MRVLLIAFILLLASCSDDDIYIINYCSKDCHENHEHNYKAEFDAEKWKNDTKQG